MSEVHKLYLSEIQHIKDCHSKFTKSADLLDRKLEAIVSIEHSNQLMVRQMMSLNEIVI